MLISFPGAIPLKSTPDTSHTNKSARNLRPHLQPHLQRTGSHPTTLCKSLLVLIPISFETLSQTIHRNNPPSSGRDGGGEDISPGNLPAAESFRNGFNRICYFIKNKKEKEKNANPLAMLHYRTNPNIINGAKRKGKQSNECREYHRIRMFI